MNIYNDQYWSPSVILIRRIRITDDYTITLMVTSISAFQSGEFDIAVIRELNRNMLMKLFLKIQVEHIYMNRFEKRHSYVDDIIT